MIDAQTYDWSNSPIPTSTNIPTPTQTSTPTNTPTPTNTSTPTLIPIEQLPVITTYFPTAQRDTAINAITYVLELGITDAAGFLDYVTDQGNEAVRLFRYDALVGLIVYNPADLTTTNLAVEVGDPLFVEVTTNVQGTLDINGDFPSEPIVFNLIGHPNQCIANFISIPINQTNLDGQRASNLADDIGDVEHIMFYNAQTKMKTYVICGLGFGDEGKGHTVAWLTKQVNATTIIRYNGGPQAGHNVIHKGKHHLFAQFGAGMAVHEKVKTFLSHQMVVSPFNLLKEATVHQQKGIPTPLQRIKIDARCSVVTTWHKILNRATEMSRENRWGSVGLGVGETLKYARQHPSLTIVMGDLVDTKDLWAKLDYLYRYISQALSYLPSSANLTNYLAQQARFLNKQAFYKALIKVGQQLAPCILLDDQAEEFLQKTLTEETTILEGAQGTLLDYEYGTKPHVTKSGTRCGEATKLLQPFLNYLNVTYIGISRPYTHRHGHGPLPTEDPTLETLLLEQHNNHNQWQGKFRVGWFDTYLAKYAGNLNPELDYLVITNVDKLASIPQLKLCIDYQKEKEPTEPLTTFLLNAHPIYKSIPNINLYLQKIQEAYQLPLFAISSGMEDAWHKMSSN